MNCWFQEPENYKELLQSEFYTSNCKSTTKKDAHILVDNDLILHQPDYSMQLLPFVFEKTAYEEETWVRLVYWLLTGELTDDLLTTRLFQGDDYASLHNQAIQHHYLSQTSSSKVIAKQLYREAIQHATQPTEEQFSTLQLIQLYRECQQYSAAYELIEQATMRFQEDEFYIDQLSFQFNATKLIEQIEDGQWQIADELAKLQETGLPLPRAMFIIDIAAKALFAEKQSLTNQLYKLSIQDLQKTNHAYLLVQTQLEYVNFLIQWSLSGELHRLKDAIAVCKSAIQTAKQHALYYEMALVQHRLGIIYAELVSDPQMKTVWSAFSANSFEEALSFFTKQTYPEEYGALCNDYAHALMKYPDMKLTKNYDKASFYFNEALSVQPKEAFGFERCQTLLNSIEANLSAQNMDEDSLEKRKQEMFDRAQEVLDIATVPTFKQLAKDYLILIEKI